MEVAVLSRHFSCLQEVGNSLFSLFLEKKSTGWKCSAFKVQNMVPVWVMCEAVTALSVQIRFVSNLYLVFSHLLSNS